MLGGDLAMMLCSSLTAASVFAMCLVHQEANGKVEELSTRLEAAGAAAKVSQEQHNGEVSSLTASLTKARAEASTAKAEVIKLTRALTVTEGLSTDQVQRLEEEVRMCTCAAVGFTAALCGRGAEFDRRATCRIPGCQPAAAA